MKTIKNYLKTLIIFILLSIFSAFILTMIRFNTNLSLSIINIIKSILSLFIFLLTSIINGKLNKKRGLINGLIMTSIFLFCIIILKVFNYEIKISLIIIKSIIIIIGNIIGVNI